jgi:hypothetical protein
VYLPTMLQVAAPSNKLIVINSNTFAPFAGSGPLYLDSEVRNDANSNVDFVKIKAVLRDATGQIVDADFTYNHAITLTPGMISGFRLRFSNPPAWATYIPQPCLPRGNPVRLPLRVVCPSRPSRIVNGVPASSVWCSMRRR